MIMRYVPANFKINYFVNLKQLKMSFGRCAVFIHVYIKNKHKKALKAKRDSSQKHQIKKVKESINGKSVSLMPRS